MTRYLSLLFPFALAFDGNCQWSSIGADMSSGSDCRALIWDSITNRLYAFGRIDSINGVITNHTAYWNGIAWQPMGTGVYPQPVIGVGIYNGQVVIGGYFQNAGGAPNTYGLAKWNGSAWSSVGDGIHGGAFAMTSIGGSLYIGGSMDTVGTSEADNLGYFDGATWNSLLPGYLPNNFDVVGAIVEYQGDVLIAGNFDSVNGCSEIGRIQGDTLLPLGPGILGDAWVNDMVVYDGDLYVAGYFFQGAGNPATGVMKWDGTSWSDPFPGVAYTNQAKDFDVFDGKLYIAGPVRPYGDTAQYPYTVARYDGTELCLLARGNTSPMRVAANDDFLFVAPNSIDPNGYNQCPLMRFDLSFPFDTCMTIIQGLDHHPVEPAFTLFPNPSEGMLTVGSSLVQGAVSIRVQDATGRVVHVVNGTHQRTFDLDHLASGPYWVTLTSEDGTTSTLPWHKL